MPPVPAPSSSSLVPAPICQCQGGKGLSMVQIIRSQLCGLVSLSYQKFKHTFRCKHHYKCGHLPQEFPGRGAISPPLDPNALNGVAIVCSVSKTSEHKCELIRGHIEWRWHFIYPVWCLVDLPEYLDATHFKGSEHHTGT